MKLFIAIGFAAVVGAVGCRGASQSTPEQAPPPPPVAAAPTAAAPAPAPAPTEAAQPQAQPQAAAPAPTAALRLKPVVKRARGAVQSNGVLAMAVTMPAPGADPATATPSPSDNFGGITVSRSAKKMADEDPYGASPQRQQMKDEHPF